jgi:hypothetical protein
MENQISNHPHFFRNVLVKGLLLFLFANLAFAACDPLPALGRVSAYNRLFPGRVRLPYGDDPTRAYNLSLFNLEAMFASHEIDAGPKPKGEFRVILIGDSSTWGFLLPPEETLAAHLNGAGLRLADGRPVRVYNLGYPVMSLAKDLMILSHAADRYQPDLIVWPLTLESFPYDKQLFPPLLQHNPEPVRMLIHAHGLKLDPLDSGFSQPTFWDRTLAGRRRDLADLVRLQLYGVMWAATGLDLELPETYTPRMEDLPAGETFHNLAPPHLDRDDLAFDVLQAGMDIAGGTPVLLINEPMFVSQGENSDIRYNFFYPRWAYDDYRELLAEVSQENGWQYVDLWDSVPPSEFTNSAVHLTPQGSAIFAEKVGEAILRTAK